MPADRRTWTLAGLGAIAIALAAWSLQGQGQAPGQGPAAAPAARRGRAAPAADARPTIEDVRIESLTSERAQPAGDGRNPFRFEAKRPAATERPAAETPVVKAPVAVAPVPTGPPPPPPIPFKFIGVVERSGGLKVAVLTDGRSVVHGREGDIIEGQYRILRIGVESIEIAYADGRGRQTIRLTGQ